MQKFKEGYYPIWDLPMEERIKQCQSTCAKFGKKLSWKEAKQFYHEVYDCETWINDIYQVDVHRNQKADYLVNQKDWKGQITYLSIKRRDKKSCHDWRHFQTIKNELVGKDCEAIELYPNENRLLDTANQYHLFCLPKGIIMPVGFQTRSVLAEELIGGFGKAGQRGPNE